MDLLPHARVLQRCEERAWDWPEIARDLEKPEVIHPLAGDRRAFCGRHYRGIVVPSREAGLVIGVDRRERPLVTSKPTVGLGIEPRRPSQHRRRGPSGRRWPTDWPALRALLERTDGVTLEHGKTHWKIWMGGRLLTTYGENASDHRAILNACLELRRQGLDVSNLR